MQESIEFGMNTKPTCILVNSSTLAKILEKELWIDDMDECILTNF